MLWYLLNSVLCSALEVFVHCVWQESLRITFYVCRICRSEVSSCETVWAWGWMWWYEVWGLCVTELCFVRKRLGVVCLNGGQFSLAGGDGSALGAAILCGAVRLVHQVQFLTHSHCLFVVSVLPLSLSSTKSFRVLHVIFSGFPLKNCKHLTYAVLP